VALQSRALEQQAYREQFELENSHWWFEGRRAVLWALLRRAGVPSGVRVLDAGCGTGRNLIEFGTLGPATGVDSSEDAIEFARRREIPGVSQGVIEQLPFEDASFDLILATDVLEHLRDDGLAISELRRVAAPGAWLLATVPAYRWLWSRHDTEHHHFRRYTSRLLRSRLAAGGWSPEAWSYFNSVLLPPIAAVRLAERVRPKNGDERPDLRMTPGWLNGILLGPMRAEGALIGAGARLPAGVSFGVISRAA
jgi:SAM-dependent methyltransferase